MAANNIIELLGFCLNNTYFLFQDQFFEQTKGAAIGSPVSPIVANIYMEAFEAQNHHNCTDPSRIRKRYVDDTIVIQHQLHKDEFFRHINSVDPSIQLTVEESRADDAIPFSDSIITPQADGTFTTGIYRKSTHTDLYLPWDSHHGLISKYSVINTLIHRAKAICSTPQLLKNELKHVEEVLMLCKYPK